MKKNSKYVNFDELGELFAKGMNIRADIVPVIDEDSEDLLLGDDSIGGEMPVLPVMDQVLLPGVILPIAASRERSRRLLSDVKSSGRHILVFTQKNDAEEPNELDLYPVGVVAKVVKVFDFRKDVTVAVLQGIVRCHSLLVSTHEPYMLGTVELAPETKEGIDTQAFRRKVKKLRSQYAELVKSRMHDDDLGHMLGGIGSDKIFINFAASHLEVEVAQKYTFLSAESYPARVDAMFETMENLRGLDELRREIDEKTSEVIGRQQREYYLRHQLDVIQEELNEGEGGDAIGSNNPDIEELRHKAESATWDEPVRQMFEKELRKVSRLSPMSPDYSMQIGYLETLVEVPWHHSVDENVDIVEARRIMDADHYGIDKVKDRIIEYMAVMKRRIEHKLTNSEANVLCLVGPPGTGKTSICRSIASAMGRPYRRVALGGLHDEAEIRGHRRTYIGAMPGRIVQELIKAGVNNPVFVLDEIDKVQHNSFNGDPTSALLEVLDPEQNSHFHDNYIGVDIDLSKVFFIATANNLSEVPPALIDRMEIIDFSGYVIEEKLEIAKRHLLPRIMTENMVDRRKLRFTSNVLTQVVNEYTREGGVRQFEKQLRKLVRHRVVMAESGSKAKSTIDAAELKDVLGLPIHDPSRRQREAREGVVTGLAWTPVGGEILFIESSLSSGKGTVTMTGNLGDVMKESATLAFEYLKSNGDRFGVSRKMIDSSNVHIHVPEGATPKDGPSAGITMFVAMISAFTHRKVRPNVAMTGEITLRGDVTPVGGIKEKILAAKRAGITDLILCHDNRRDVEDITPAYLEGLTFHYIGSMHEALPLALEKDSKKVKVKGPKAVAKVFSILAMALILHLPIATLRVQAQESAFRADQQKMALLPGDVSGVSIVDGNLYCYASQVLLTAQRSAGEVLGFWADTTSARLAPDVNFVIRHPLTGDIYFTQVDKKGHSQLYHQYIRPDGKVKMRRVRLSKLSVEHPAFTSNGRIMIFSAKDKHRGFGGYDLWYSTFENGRWSRPVNLGGRINTSYDEMTPTIYRDCLLFSSNGHDIDHAYLNIYSSRLLSLRSMADTVGKLQIGHCRVQKLPEPLNSPDADDLEMVIDTALDCGYWVSKRVESDTDSQLFSFNGSLDGVLLNGRVSDKYDNLLSGVDVSARQNGFTVAHTVTDEEGYYRLYLRCDQYYDISYKLDGYFSDNVTLNTVKTDDEYLIAEAKQNISLDRLLLGQRMYYEDIFGPGASVELSEYGIEKLESLVRFLTDNPMMEVDMSLTSDITADALFNKLLTGNRLLSLQEYLYRVLSPSVKLNFTNGCSESNCASASGQTRLVLVINEAKSEE